MASGKYYKNGLHFECVGCGKCCTHPEGYVEATVDEASRIADYLGISEAEFMEKFVESSNTDVLFLRSFPDGECVFLKNERCTIYPVRPVQCSTYPFWAENVKSAYRWKLTALECPGINEGRLHTADEIETILSQMKKDRSGENTKVPDKS